MHRLRNRQAAMSNRYGPHATDPTRWPVVLRGADFSALKRMQDQSADMLEFAAILGEAIARAHLAGKIDVRTSKSNIAARQHVAAVSSDGETRTICSMAESGHSNDSIASVTGFSVEMIRDILVRRE